MPERVASAEKNCDTNCVVIDLVHWLASGCTSTAVSVAVIAAASAGRTGWWADTAVTCSRWPLRCTGALEPVEVRSAFVLVGLRSETAPHPATTQTVSNIVPLRLTVPERQSALTAPFMPRMTRRDVDPFQRSAVTNLTNRSADPTVPWVKASYRGFPTMINVVCYCGHAYSFAGDVGSCPRCGEYVFFARGSDEERRATDETIAKIVGQASGGSPPGELAA